MSDKLNKKLGQVYQRRRARETAKILPEHIHSLINFDDISYKEDIYSRHQLPLFPKGVGGKFVYPEGYSLYEYSEVDQLSHLVNSIESACLNFEKNCLVSLNSDSGFWLLMQCNVDSFLSYYLEQLGKNFQSLVVFQSDYKKGV